MVICLLLSDFLCIFPCFFLSKGQLISKANCQAVNSSKKRTNEFGFTTMRRVFVRFCEEIEDTKKTFQNYLTFSKLSEVKKLQLKKKEAFKDP